MFDDIIGIKIIQDWMYDSKGNEFKVDDYFTIKEDKHSKVWMKCIDIQDNIATFKWIAQSDDDFTKTQEQMDESYWVKV